MLSTYTAAIRFRIWRLTSLFILTVIFAANSLAGICLAQPMTDQGPEVRRAERAWGSTLFGPPKSLIVGPRHDFAKIGGVVYKQGEDYELKCDVFMPDGQGPYPAVVAVHGGSWRTGSKVQMARHAWLMAQSGYVVVAINYRHAPAYRFPAQLQDLKHAVRWMRANASTYKIDPDQISGFGYSAGGHMVSLLALQPDNELFDCPDSGLDQYDAKISAVIAGGAPCGFDWVGEHSYLLKYLFGGTKHEKSDLYRSASPVNFVNAQSPPFYFFHGEYDFVVPPSSSQRLHRKLLSLGIESRYDIVQGCEHIVPFSKLEYMQRGLLFLRRHIKHPPAEMGDTSIVIDADATSKSGID